MGNADVELVTVAKPANKKSLLERYDIPVEHLSYEYIDRSTEVKELERIVLILRSGEEGIYPDLTKHAESRLAAIKPESSVLRVAEPVLTREMLAPERRQKLENDMNQWMNEMKLREKDLEEGRSLQIEEPIPQPDVRKIAFNERKKEKSLQNGDKSKRIGSFDYAAWDKYDADTELNRIDLQQEQRRAEVRRTQRKLREKEGRIKKTSRETIVNKLALTGTEYNIMAEAERKKGNEAFRAGDYEEALQSYDLSIGIDATTEAHNNRAMTFIKLRRYGDAVNDCNRVISVEHANVKALLRRALALEHLEKKAQALVDYEAVLKLEPTNKIAIAAVNKLRSPCASKKIKMKITEEAEEIGTSGITEVRNADRQGREKSRRISCETGSSTTSEKSTNRRNFSVAEKKSIPAQPRVCFCSNAPSSSRQKSPLPHMRNNYCSGWSEKSPELRKLQSIFTDCKKSREKSSSVIIEEIPIEPIEKPAERILAKTIVERPRKKIEGKNAAPGNLGSGDRPKKIGKLVEEIPEKKVSFKANIVGDEKIEKSGESVEEIPERKVSFKANIVGDEKTEKSGESVEEIPERKVSFKANIVGDEKTEKSGESVEEIPERKVSFKANIVGDEKTEKSGESVEEIPERKVSFKANIVGDEKTEKSGESVEEIPERKVSFKANIVGDEKTEKSSESVEEIPERKVSFKANIVGDEKTEKSGESVEEIPERKVSFKANIVGDEKTEKSGKSVEEIPERKVSLKANIVGDEKTEKPGESVEEIPERKVSFKANIVGDEKTEKSGEAVEEIPERKVSFKANIVGDEKTEKSGESVEEIPEKKVSFKANIVGDEKTEKSGESVEEIPERKANFKEDKTFENVSTPYEFVRVWHSLKNDSELILRARLLQSLAPENIEGVIGNKLDGDMLCVILRCFERHFCIPTRATFLHRFLQSLTRVQRFSMICMFMDQKDRKVLRNVFLFLETQGLTREALENLRKAYDTSM